jgi:hypothetical protein
VTADAAFTYRTVVEAIRAKGADYFLVVKGNQPDLCRPNSPTPSVTIPPSRVAATLGVPNRPHDPPDLRRAETAEKAHGRIESRRIAIRKPPARLDALWPGVRKICRIERIREMKTYYGRQIIYTTTSLPPSDVGAAQLLDLARAH